MYACTPSHTPHPIRTQISPREKCKLIVSDNDVNSETKEMGNVTCVDTCTTHMRIIIFIYVIAKW